MRAMAGLSDWISEKLLPASIGCSWARSPIMTSFSTPSRLAIVSRSFIGLFATSEASSKTSTLPRKVSRDASNFGPEPSSVGRRCSFTKDETVLAVIPCLTTSPSGPRIAVSLRRSLTILLAKASPITSLPS